MALRRIGLLRHVLSKTEFAGRVGRATMHGTPQPLADPSDSEFDCKYEAYFNRGDIDGWEIRKGLSDLHGMDLIPDPKVINAALRACRRVNDYALAVRCLESVKLKCGNNLKVIWPYILQEIQPTLDELGVDTPEELGYDKPELHTPSVYESPPPPKLSDEPKPQK
uniref:Cytochrome c oxidase subunit 5A, mitochondrial n=1 Tax=Lygus hesperus TaxID=30085 RepID=A0A146KXW9_LYGHE